MSLASRHSAALLWCLFIGLNAPIAGAAWLQLGDSQVQDGVVYVPVVFDPGPDTVASLQFDVPYESRRFVFLHAEPGPAAISAGKDVLPGARSGKITLVVAGMNQSAIGAGVLAGLYFEVIPEGKGEARISLDNHILSDPRGNAVAHQRPRDETPPPRDRPTNEPDTPPGTERGATATENAPDDALAATSSEAPPASVRSPADADSRGGYGPPASRGAAQSVDSPRRQHVASQPGSDPASAKTGVAGSGGTDGMPGATAHTMPKHMPLAPGRPATAPNGERNTVANRSAFTQPVRHGETTPQRSSTAQQSSLDQAEPVETSVPLDREQLAAIRAARAQDRGNAHIVSDSETESGIAKRPLPLGAMVFTGLAALLLLVIGLRRVGILGLRRRSISA